MTTRALLDKLRLSDLNPGASSGGGTRETAEWITGSGDQLVSHNPTTGEPIAAAPKKKKKKGPFSLMK